MNGDPQLVEVPNGWNLPSPLYVDEDSNLQLAVRTSLGVTLTLRARYMLCDGSAHGEEVQFAPVADFAEHTVNVRLRRGYLISLLVFASGGTPRRGHTYVVVRLVRGLSGDVQPVHVLAKGYIVAGAGLFWPGGPYEDSVSGMGLISAATGTDPAAGVQISETVPIGGRWRIRSVRATLVTSAVVAARQVHLVIDDGATIILESVCTSTQAASLTRNYNAAAYGASPGSVASELYILIPPDLVLFQGWRIRTAVDLFDAGDNWGAAEIWIEAWTE